MPLRSLSVSRLAIRQASGNRRAMRDEAFALPNPSPCGRVGMGPISPGFADAGALRRLTRVPDAGLDSPSARSAQCAGYDEGHKGDCKAGAVLSHSSSQLGPPLHQHCFEPRILHGAGFFLISTQSSLTSTHALWNSAIHFGRPSRRWKGLHWLLPSRARLGQHFVS